MKINYCLPIIKKNKEEIFKIIETNISDYQYFEVWLDYVENLDEAFITKLTNLLENHLIVLFRRLNLEPIIMDVQHRLDIISLVSTSESFLDLDITQKEELEYVQKNAIKINIIISYHDYHETPSDQKLKDILAEMKKYNPTIYKIATICVSEDDAIKLLQLQGILKKENKRHIVLGMGKFGTITRVFGALWGNEMIFAPETIEDQSAPGQLTKMQLENIFKQLQ